LAIVSHLFSPLDHLYIFDRQRFSSAPETDDNRSATVFPDMAKISVGYLVMKLNAF
jgi:hypothetical protein